MMRVLVTDDHNIVSDGLRVLIEDTDGMECVGTAPNGKQALEIVRSIPVDVVLMDIDMPIMNGIEATRAIKRDFPQVKVLNLTMHKERGMVQRMMECGADGYMLKNADRSELVQAIQAVAAGHRFFSDDVDPTNVGRVEQNVMPGEATISDITEREAEIIRLLAQGLSSKDIGDKLFISNRTVDTHRTNIMTKLGLNNVAGLIRWAFNNGYAD